MGGYLILSLPPSMGKPMFGALRQSIQYLVSGSNFCIGHLSSGGFDHRNSAAGFFLFFPPQGLWSDSAGNHFDLGDFWDMCFPQFDGVKATHKQRVQRFPICIHEGAPPFLLTPSTLPEGPEKYVRCHFLWVAGKGVS